MSVKPIPVITQVKVIPKNEAEALDTLRQLVLLTRQKEGCIRYDPYCDSTCPMRVNTLKHGDRKRC